MNERSCLKNHPEPAATAWRCSECAKSLTGLPEQLRRQSVCEHRGEVRRVVECHSCFGRVSLKVYECTKHGECSMGRPIKGVAGVCEQCRDFIGGISPAPMSSTRSTSSAESVSFGLVAPVGSGGDFKGVAVKKPWQFKVTAIIPHLNTPQNLPVLIGLLRLQTEAPFIIIIDTGSPPGVCEEIERLRSQDVEIHFVKGNGYVHPSEPVCVALDLGMARANTPLLFLTHTDCFPMRRDAVQYLADLTSELSPAVGWEMSDRSWLTDQWRGMLSHTFTMLHAPTMRRIGATWHMARAREELGGDAAVQKDGWPDTETGFAFCLRDAGVRPMLLGPEVNYERQTTEWWDHSRSLTGISLYAKGSAKEVAGLRAADAALADATARWNWWRLSPARVN